MTECIVKRGPADSLSIVVTPEKNEIVRAAIREAGGKYTGDGWLISTDKLAKLNPILRAQFGAVKRARLAKRDANKIEEQQARADKKKTDTRRKIILGSAVQAEMLCNPAFVATINELIQDHITRKSDRALFGVE